MRAAQPERGRALEYLNEQSQSTRRFGDTAESDLTSPAADTEVPVVVALETLPHDDEGGLGVPAEVVSLGTYRKPVRRQRSAPPLGEPADGTQPLRAQSEWMEEGHGVLVRVG